MIGKKGEKGVGEKGGKRGQPELRDYLFCRKRRIALLVFQLNLPQAQTRAWHPVCACVRLDNLHIPLTIRCNSTTSSSFGHSGQLWVQQTIMSHPPLR